MVHPSVWVENPRWFVERLSVCRGRGAGSRRPRRPSDPATRAGLTAQEVRPACFLGPGPADAPGTTPLGGKVLSCLVLKYDPWQLQGSPRSADWGVCVARPHVQTPSWASVGRSPLVHQGAGTSCVDGAAARQTGSPRLFLCTPAGLRKGGASPGSASLEELLQRAARGVGWHWV